MSLLEISHKEIEELEPSELVELLKILLNNEIEKCSPRDISKLTVPSAINIKDGGIDGFIEFDSKISFNSKFLKTNFISFQCKATEMTDSYCYEAVLKKRPKAAKGKKTQANSARELNTMVEDCFTNLGEYILFTTDTYGTNDYSKREAKIRKAIKDAGKSYHTTAKIRVLDSQLIADWCNDHLPAIIYVKEKNNQALPIVCWNWERWQAGSQKDNKLPFCLTESVEKLSDAIVNNIAVNRILRILGHSGIGKSRLIRETFKPQSANKMASMLSKNLLYIDMALHSEQGLYALISNNWKKNGLIIVDNCKELVYSYLESLLGNSNTLKIITIDNSITERKDSNTFILNNILQKETVKGIFEKEFTARYNENEITMLVNLSDGYPRMAEYICESLESGDISNLSLPFEEILKNFVKKLIFGPDDPVEKIYNVIQAASLFKEFGFIDPDIKGIAENNYLDVAQMHGEFIAQHVCSPAITVIEFNRIIEDLKKNRGILKRSRYNYYVVPEPLAANLTAEWLSIFPLPKTIELAVKLKECGLIEAFCDRLSTLDQISIAKPIVARLLSDKSPFSTAEELNTNVGSRIFRSLVIVDPETTLGVLNNLYLNKSKDELLKVNIGRKNLVMALEKLCFRKETFEGAAKLVLEFAIAENENIANNATNLFTQLFHVLLPGTEANLNQRMEVIEYSIKKSDEHVNMGIIALAHALRFDNFIRMGGAEKQEAFRPLKDYHPSNEEILFYWEKAINILKDLSISYPQFMDKIKDVVISGIYPLVKCGKGELISETIKSIYKNDNDKWEEVVEKLHWLNSKGDFKEEERNILNSLFEHFSPKDLKSKLKLIITFPSFRYGLNSKGENIDFQKIDVELLAEEVSVDVKALYPHLEDILNGPQKQAFIFGKRLGELISVPEELIENVLGILTRSEEKKQNYEFLGGLLFNVSKEEKRAIVRRIIANPNTFHSAIYLTRIWLATKEDVFCLFGLIDEGKLPITSFDGFAYGRVLDNLEEDEIIELTQKIFKYENGQWTALSLIIQYALDNDQKWPKCLNTIIEFLSKHNYLTDENATSFSKHYWRSAVTKILSQKENTDSGKQEEFAKVLSTQIHEYLVVANLKTYENDVNEVAKVLIANYFELFFEKIKTIILSSGNTYHNLQSLLGGGIFSDETSLLFENGTTYKFILEFCKENGVEAALRVLNLLRVSDLYNGESRLHPLAIMILEEFHSEKEVLAVFGNKLGRGGMIPSMTSYYESQIKLLAPLLIHSNSNIKTWANKHNSYLNDMVKKEKIKEEKQLS